MDLKTILAIISGILVLSSLVWTNRYHIEQAQKTARDLEIEVAKLDTQIHRLEIELAKSSAEREARENAAKK
jgi:hypothetical protein